MIILDFKNIESFSCILPQEKQNPLTDDLYSSLFYGNQIFEVNGMRFSGDYPILGFARELKSIAHKIKNYGENGVYSDPESQHREDLEFTLDENLVTVTAVVRSTRFIARSTKIPVEEFYAKSSKYLERVTEYCFERIPELKSNPDVHQWLTDFSLRSYSAMGSRSLFTGLVILDFRNVLPGPSKRFDEPLVWADWASVYSFPGKVTFLVGDFDFRMIVPVLGFARKLNEVGHNLSIAKASDSYNPPQSKEERSIQFSLDGDQILISLIDLRSGNSLCSATAKRNEFVKRSSKYLERVVNYCSYFAPELLSDSAIRQWLTDFSIPTSRS
ncbi:MAG: hypothetical protein IT342_18470 [Candidatus Melainabacteria bacterium]|nr:hypothetical protein [Candidatus Melainabacteria bacterium]